MMGAPDDQEWEKLIPELRKVILEGRPAPDALLARFGFDQVVLDKVMAVVMPSLSTSADTTQ